MENNYNIKAVERALLLLKSFTADQFEWSLADLAAAIDLNKSTTFRMASTLVAHNILKLGEDGKYRLGAEIYRLSAIDNRDSDMKAESRSHMQKLAALTGETVVLAKYDNYRSICLDKVESSSALKITSQIGSEVPLLIGATGKIIAAFLTEAELDKCIAVHQAIYDLPLKREKLLRSLEPIRRNGYCVTCNEVDMGVAGLAAPLFNYTGRVVGSLSIAGPNFRFRPDEAPSFIEAAVESSLEISRKLGYVQIG